MAANARLAVAVHTLGMLAFAEEMPVTSEEIAGSVSTNAVSIRRVFQALSKAGLVVGQMGPNGGARLARDPGRITLADVWRAVDDDELFALPKSGGNPSCSMNRSVRPVLAEIFDDATAALEASLGQVTLADVIGRVLARSGDAHLAACRGGGAGSRRSA
jgi:Rrf2 family protein